MPNIVFLDTSTVGDVPNLDCFKEFGDVTFYDQTTPAQLPERIENQEIIITNKVVIDRKIIEQFPKLQLICIAATGMNNVDLEAAAAHNIQVKNVSDYSTQSVTQSTFAGLFYLLHRFNYYDKYVKEGSYSRSPIFTHIHHNFWQLKDKTFGIIGLGNIGKSVAVIAAGFGCRVIYYSTSGKNRFGGYPSVSFDQLLQTSDVVSIHAPLNENTLNLINYPALKLMKNSAFLLNVGRGKIVNEADLARAIDEDLIAGAFLDVLEQEPINPDNPLLRVKNKEKLLITPHMTWASIESRTLLIDKTYQNIREFLNT